jgi:hypothetical protein
MIRLLFRRLLLGILRSNLLTLYLFIILIEHSYEGSCWNGAGWVIDPGEALAIGPMGAALFSVRSTRFAQTVSSLKLKMITPINGP